jgi:hypothetical protein
MEVEGLGVSMGCCYCYSPSFFFNIFSNLSSLPSLGFLLAQDKAEREGEGCKWEDE